MQTQLPLFPGETKLINTTLGYIEHEGFRYYLHNGNPIYCHSLTDRNSYRFILGNLVSNHLCSITELSEALGEGRKNIERYAKTFREKGASYFFSRKETRGQCYKLTESLRSAIQSCLDEGESIYRISKDKSVSEAAIRYHIQKGNLKKKQI
jgi:biotin operon repressor